ncbi:virulence factor [Marinilactibacillus piezotolerans]|uniref:Virulence factor n=1 Tax=Marinilactibacillus piezotolerans TaxID=258723 RepID=A0A1I3W7X8_9LACT|nr:Gfo/Idh/MocA family oxidoreductase [Marinilactibacillus piezotolerans]SFK03688.1 virulence factor [Marinilactibacillus piezotolerans]
MKVGVIGLGTIAQKAYLPMMMTEHPEVEWHLSTRNKEKLEVLGEKYRINAEQLHTDWEDLLDLDIDAVFIHTPTTTHAEIIRAMLEKRIAVFVDKPISDRLEETKELIKLSKETNTLLMTGFNRRFAPRVKELKEIQNKNMIFFQKNQANQPTKASRYRIYDLMIHPIDTALHMVDGPVRIIGTGIVGTEDALKRAWVMLESESANIMVSVNTESGARLETMEVQSSNETVRLENLADFTRYNESGLFSKSYGDWENTLYKRGFASMIDVFLETVETNGVNPVPLDSVLQSHEVCETILGNAGF